MLKSRPNLDFHRPAENRDNQVDGPIVVTRARAPIYHDRVLEQSGNGHHMTLLGLVVSDNDSTALDVLHLGQSNALLASELLQD